MKTTRRQALALLGSTSLAACGAVPVGVSQSDYDPFEGGIGGTGIVGTLNGFGSLLINGLRVELAGTTQFRTPFGRIGEGELRRGQLLTVSARRGRDGLLAQNVSVDYALVGTLKQSLGGMTVNGVPVTLATGAVGEGHSGARVAVSGTWRHGGVLATRIDPAASNDDLIAGTVDRVNGRAFRIGGVDIQSNARVPQHASYAIALGRHEAGGLVANDVQEGRFDSRASLAQLSVEGYLEPTASAPGFRVAGLGHSFARDVRLGDVGARRAIYFGRYDGLFGASRGFVVPDAFDARRALLDQGFGDGFTGDVIRL